MSTPRGITAGILGASGYVGGELLRILLQHPAVRIGYATSSRRAGRRVDRDHPNLRGLCDLLYSAPDLAALPPVDVLFTTSSGGDRPQPGRHAQVVVDLGTDLRLAGDPTGRARHYATPVPPVGSTALGLPEINRDAVRTADLIAVPGCMATAATLALHPLSRENITGSQVSIDGRVGSSGSGASAGDVNLHAERAHVLRVFAATSHRHQAEVAQHTGLQVRMSATGYPAVRGSQVVCRTTLASGATGQDVRQAYRRAYHDEPFVRLIAQSQGNFRLPEPKILWGSNYCDVGYATDAEDDSLVVIAALDNLVKGSAGNAVQCMNVRFEHPEATGLGFPGLHPI